MSVKVDNLIKKLNKLHNKKYSYKDLVYKKLSDKVVIECLIHGNFSQILNDHLSGSGCSKCKGNNKLTTQQFIEKAKKVHGETYDYSKVDYINNKTKVIIKCLTHGDFEQRPTNHLNGQGCPFCGIKTSQLSRTVLPRCLLNFRNKTRSLINKAFYVGNFTKNSKTAQILGCTWQEFKQHLENNPYGFKIDDKDIELDHIVPVSSAKSEQELIKLNHYTNFQLLPSYYNRHIKSNNIFDKNHFENYIKSYESENK